MPGAERDHEARERAVHVEHVEPVRDPPQLVQPGLVHRRELHDVALVEHQHVGNVGVAQLSQVGHVATLRRVVARGGRNRSSR